MSVDKYEMLSDEQLMELIQADNQDALDFLLNKYKYLVMKQARTLFLIGADRDDLIQEGMIGLYKAICNYDSNEAKSFAYYAGICINSQMYNAIKASNRQKNIPLNSYISFSSEDFQISSNQMNPEKMIIDRERVNNLRYKLINMLSKFETDVFNLYMEGNSYTKIGEILNKSPKSIDNAIQRIKSKMTSLLKENEN